MSKETHRTLDWDKLKAWVAERQPVEVSAGLAEDWFWTGATVYENGAYKEDHGAFTHSHWATPCFKADMPNGDTIEVICSREATPEDHATWAKEREEHKTKMKDLADKVRAYKTP